MGASVLAPLAAFGVNALTSFLGARASRQRQNDAKLLQAALTDNTLATNPEVAAALGRIGGPDFAELVAGGNARQSALANQFIYGPGQPPGSVSGQVAPLTGAAAPGPATGASPVGSPVNLVPAAAQSSLPFAARAPVPPAAATTPPVAPPPPTAPPPTAPPPTGQRAIPFGTSVTQRFGPGITVTKKGGTPQETIDKSRIAFSQGMAQRARALIDEGATHIEANSQAAQEMLLKYGPAAMPNRGPLANIGFGLQKNPHLAGSVIQILASQGINSLTANPRQIALAVADAMVLEAQQGGMTAREQEQAKLTVRNLPRNIAASVPRIAAETAARLQSKETVETLPENVAARALQTEQLAEARQRGTEAETILGLGDTIKLGIPYGSTKRNFTRIEIGPGGQAITVPAGRVMAVSDEVRKGFVTLESAGHQIGLFREAVDTLKKKLPGGSGDRTIKWLINNIKVATQSDPDLVQLDVLLTTITPLVRGVFQNVGNIAVPELERIEKTFPKITDRYIVALRKLDNLEAIMGGMAIAQLAGLGSYIVTPDGQMLPPAGMAKARAAMQSAEQQQTLAQTVITSDGEMTLRQALKLSAEGKIDDNITFK